MLNYIIMNEKISNVRTRFAPSPTGFVHIGSLRTALFAYLLSRHNNGANVLRIEDTDQGRLVEGAVENLLKVMGTIGIKFDEGPSLSENGTITEKGDYGPYVQSRRLDLYTKYAQQLIDSGHAYYCFCSENRLKELRTEQEALKKPTRYDQHCRHLTEEQKQAGWEQIKKEGRQPVIRFAIPAEGQTVVHDLIYGDIIYPHGALDDQIIVKSDGFPTYHLAVVVDDHLMKISHVVRGEDWMSSTPKHILIYQALGWEPTKFAHMPNIIDPLTKKKLSKRDGDVSVEDFLAKGYLKEALINFVMFLGWNPKTEQEVFSMEELVAQFNLDNVNKSGAIFDINKLDWMNSLYIRAKKNEDLVGLLLPYWQKAGMETEKFKKEYLVAITVLEKERLKKLSEIGERTGYYFKQPEYDASLLTWKKSTSEDAKQKLMELADLLSNLDENKFTKTDLEITIKQFITDKHYDNGSVLWPLRAALTGQEKSPGPFEVCAILALGLGKQEIISRLGVAIQKI